MNTTASATTLLSNKQQFARVNKQLTSVGVTQFGLSKFVVRYLPSVLNMEENIEAAVYGRYRESDGLFSLAEGWLVATDRRVIFLDHKPGYTSMDEMGYDAVSGVQKTTAGWFSAITLHSKLGDYTIRYANNRCVAHFMRTIETKRLEKSKDGLFMQQQQQLPTHHAMPIPNVDSQALSFLRMHDTAVLSSITRDGEAHGAVIYYVVGKNNCIYMLTKGGTQKAHNIFAHKSVALTVFDKERLQTVQLQGIGEIEASQEVKDWVFAEIVKPRPSQNGMSLPPVTTIQDGAYMIIKITPSWARFIDFSQHS